MPKLGTATIQLSMPSSTDTDPAVIEVKAAVYPLDVLDLRENDLDAYTLFITLATRIIVSWNYTDQNNQPAPVTKEWIDRLTDPDKKVLSEYVTKLFDKSFEGVSSEEKKTLSSPLTETPTPTPASPPSI